MHNYRQDTNMGDWMGQHTKRLVYQERRPQLRSAPDIMGPGLGPRAVQLLDWDDEATLFNGVFFSAPGALHGPDPALWWMGENWAAPDGYGYQLVRNFRDGDVLDARVRSVISVLGTRNWTTWASA